MLRPSPKSEQVFQEIMGEQTNMSRKYNVRPRKQVDYEKQGRERQGHMIQGNVDIQRNVYEK
jgi:riboflavin synthase alpha subunit